MGRDGLDSGLPASGLTKGGGRWRSAASCVPPSPGSLLPLFFFFPFSLSQRRGLGPELLTEPLHLSYPVSQWDPKKEKHWQYSRPGLGQPLHRCRGLCETWALAPKENNLEYKVQHRVL